MSRDSQKFSDEFLNAFVDDQLTPEEKGRAYPQISQDEALNRQVCELRKMRDLVRLAYNDVQPALTQTPAPPRRHAGLGWAAALALVLSGLVGWVLHGQIGDSQATSASSQAQATPKAWRQTPPADPVKIVVHLSEGDPAHVRQVLDDVEGLLRLYRRTGYATRVEVVMNGDGLQLVRADTSAAPDRIRRMQKDYDNLTFVACQNAIDRLRKDHGIIAQLLPGVAVIDSGMAQLMRRQHQGWAYIQA